MKTVAAAVLVSAGLASAFDVVERQANVSAAASAVDPNLVNGQDLNNNDLLNSQLLDCLGLAGLEGGLNLNDLNGLNLGSDVLNIDQLLGGSSFEDLIAQELGGANLGGGIEELLGGMGLDGVVQEQQLEQLNEFEQLEMFLMLEQLMQLSGLGFLDQNQILELLSGSLNLGGNNLGNLNLDLGNNNLDLGNNNLDLGNNLNNVNDLNLGAENLGNLNIGVLKRGVEVVKTDANSALRARQQQCAQVAGAPAAAVAPAAAIAPAAAVASAAPAVASVASAASAASVASSGENLSDFTK